MTLKSTFGKKKRKKNIDGSFINGAITAILGVALISETANAIKKI